VKSFETACFDSFILKASQEVRRNPRASARERFEKKLSLGGQRQVSQKKSGIRTQESGVAEYASRVFIRKSGTGICPGKSPGGIPDSLAPELLQLLISSLLVCLRAMRVDAYGV